MVTEVAIQIVLIGTERYLLLDISKTLFKYARPTDVCEHDCPEVWGYDHGWINLGVKGRKP